MYQNLAILAAFVLVYSAVAGRLEKTPISGAIVAMGFGFACGPLGLGIFTPHVDGELLRTLAELTLALVLFTDAANANLSVLKSSRQLPERLLLIGLPLTILLGFGIGILVFPGMGLFELAVLATMLAPTDAALGKAVVTNPAVPAALREGLNVESGLNDGICVPILFVFLALASRATVNESGFQLALVLVAQQIGIGLAVGIGLTAAAGWILKRCAQRKWITETWRQLPVVALAFVCFAAAQVLGGSGFIASFTGGILFGALAKEHKHDLLRAAEGAGDTLSLATWMSFGAAVVGQVIWEIQLADPDLFHPQPDRRSHVAGIPVACRFEPETGQPALPRVVRSARSCQRRVRRHRPASSPPGRAGAGADGSLHGDLEHPRARVQREPACGVTGCKAG